MSLGVGRDFFPPVDAGLIQLHVRAPARTRIERTEQIFAAVEDAIRQQIPPKDLGLVLDNIGLPQRLYNLAFTDGTTIGVNDGQILLQLNEGHTPTADYVKALRKVLPTAFPDVQFYFQPADLATQVLNFGVPAQVDVQVQGRDRDANQRIAGELRQRLANIPGLTDVHVQQELDAPELSYTIDRTRAQQLGLTLNQVATDLNISLSSSEQVAPNFWTDPKNGIPYYFAVQTPEYRIASKNDLDNTPIGSSLSGGNGGARCVRQRCNAPNANQSSRSTIIPTFNRSTTSTPACRIETLAAPPPLSSASCRTCRANSAPATGS